MNPSTRTTITTLAAVALAIGGLLGPRPLAVAVLLLSFALALGWPVLTWIPHWITGSAIVLGAGALATIGVLLGVREPYLRHMVVALALAAVAALVVEVFQPSPPGTVLTAVAGTVGGATVAAAGAAWIAAARTPGAEDLVVTGAVALALGAVASTLTPRMSWNAVIALSVGAIFGAAAGIVFPTFEWYGGALVGLSCTAAVVMIHEVTRRETETESVWAGIAAGVTPVTVAGALVYISARLLIG